MEHTKQGRVLGLAYRANESDEMRKVSSCVVQPGQGLVDEARKPGKRQVTLLSDKSWADACEEVGAVLDWTLRRANVLLQGVNLQAALGKTISIGEVSLLVHGETRPCALMDEQHNGLTKALVPEYRGGVYAEVTTGGTINIGDAVNCT